jgi:hypothetical protein
MVQVLFLVGALTLVVATMLETQFLFAKVAIRRTAESYLTAAGGVATAAMLRQLAGEVLANGPGSALTVAPLPAQCIATNACTFEISASYAVTGSTLAGGGTDVAANLQTDVLAQEARTSIVMTVTITDGQGSPLVSRAQLLTVRTFAAPPYAAVSGVADAAAVTALAADGDTAGCDPLAPASCDPNATAVDDTRISVARVCQSDGNGGTCPGGDDSYPLDFENAFTNASWQNGNVAPPGWAR